MKVSVIVIFILSTISSSAQTKTVEKIKIKKSTDSTAQIPVPQSEIIDYIQTQPEYPGGIPALMKFISANMNIPLEANDPMCTTIYATFIITKDGDVTNVKILKGANGCPKCDEEAVRVIQSMPKWKPATDKGKPVATVFNLPIRVKIR